MGDDTGGTVPGGAVPNEAASIEAPSDGATSDSGMAGDGMAGDGFEEHRRYLTSVAYRLLGSVADAEDAVQDAWLRWRTVDRASVQDPRAYLTRVVTRLCYDMLGSARARREAYYGEWLPEPLLTDGEADGAPKSPEDLATLGESVSFAMLAVMEQLTPAERAAFVLHDVFAVGFEEIAAALEKTPDAARQLASRARRRVRERPGAQRRGERGPVGRAEHRKAVEAFAAATLRGDLPALLTVLAPDVVWHSDGGGVVRGAGVRPVATADRVSRLLAGLGARWLLPDMTFELTDVNGDPGLVMHDERGVLIAVFAFAVEDGRIVEAFASLNPAKLAHLPGGGEFSHHLRQL